MIVLHRIIVVSFFNRIEKVEKRGFYPVLKQISDSSRIILFRAFGILKVAMLRMHKNPD